MKLFATSFNPAAIEDLVALAAEATAKDSNGNNALHLLALEKKLDDIEYAMEFLPISLLEENNHEGLCPMDIIREKITRRKKDD